MELQKPNMDQFKTMMENPNEGPVVMLNLSKFNPDGGLASYGLYGEEMEKLMAEVGGKMIFLGKPKELLIGDETWDVVILASYPSRKAFVKMVSSPAYREAHKHRAAAIERAVQYAVDEMSAQEILFEGKEK